VEISEENKLNATTQQLITAKISGCALKQGSKTHSYLHQSRTVGRNVLIRGLWVCAGELDTLKIDKNSIAS